MTTCLYMGPMLHKEKPRSSASLPGGNQYEDQGKHDSRRGPVNMNDRSPVEIERADGLLRKGHEDTYLTG